MEVKLCKRGHPQTKNTVYYCSNNYGRISKVCRLCKNLLAKDKKAKAIVRKRADKEAKEEDISEQVEMLVQPKRHCNLCGKINPPNRYYNCESCVTLADDDSIYGIY